MPTSDAPHLTVDGRPGHIAELDGLRALAVIPVIAYHFGASINGGAGVTVFFALSGYIVTTVLLREHEQRGTIHLRGFYIRRLRRLLPASTIVVIATVLVGRAMHRPSIFRQSVASLTYWANFERYTSHYSYGATAYAPLEHYWSLAIEEQFYLLLPVVCLVMLPLGRRLFASLTALCLVASATFAYLHRHDPQMYFHTGARACELLAGVVLAIVAIRLPSWLGLLGLAGLFAVVAGAVSPPHVVIALLACVVIASRPRILAASPLVVIGTYSYGLYLWHPLAALLSDQLVVRIAITIAATVMSFHLVEFPIRRTMTVRPAIAAMALASLTAVVVVALPEHPTLVSFLSTAPVEAAAPPPLSTVSSTSDPAKVPEAPAAVQPVLSTTTTTAPRPRPIRISGAGDSTQMFADAAWQAWSAAYPDAVRWVTPPDAIVPWTSGADSWIRDVAPGIGLSLPHDGPQGGIDRQGCPLIYDLKIRPITDWLGGFFDTATLHSSMPVSSCDWHLWIPSALSQMRLDILIVSWGVTASWQYQMPDGHVGHIGQPEFDAFLSERMAEFESMAAQYGTRVLWLDYQMLPSDPKAVPATRETADALAAVVMQRPCAVDFRSIVRADPTFNWYQDGYHFTPEGAARAIAAIMPAFATCEALPRVSPAWRSGR
ncbi:MAG: acyltransferase family protein [Ilumatobacteraceae bacterium]